ncbi:MAG TPA: sigma-70 family RNA polymerase sigma factor [Kofleriaceae bacterium]|nr:sigma-70 family RNA polymerase sigma factor [Kofleriaceae bacterium]
MSSCEHACFVAWVTRLVRAERPTLVAIARGEGLADSEALDAVQEGLITFLGLPSASELVDQDRDGARLLSTVIRNAARNARRKHHRARPHDGDLEAIAGGEDTAAAVARAEARLAMSSCVAELGEGAQRVVMMRLLDELSGDEVAAELGTTTGNVAVMLHRAKEKLRACLEDARVTP